MKKLVLLILLLSIAGSFYSQQVIIRDQVTLETLPGAVLVSGQLFSVSDNRGVADVSSMKGSTVIEVRMIGYETKKLSYSDIEAAGFRISLSTITYYSGEVVVSASRFQEKREDVAQQVQVISKRDIAFLSQQSTADLLMQSGNVMVQKSQQGGGSPIMRGFEANKVLLVVDGVRMNNAIYRGGHLQNVITVDQFLLERAEMAFGPGSVIYGSDAFGGVVHMFTRTPKYAVSEKIQTEVNAAGRYSTVNNERTGHVDLAFSGKKFASLTSFTFSSFGDLRSGDLRDSKYDSFGRRYWYAERINGVDSMVTNSNPNLQKGTAYDQMDFLQKIRFRTGRTTDHTINFQYSTSSDIPRYDRLTEMSGSKPSVAQWYYGPQERMLISYSVAFNDSTKIYDAARLTIGFQDIGESRHTRNFGSSTRNHRTESVQVITANYDLMKKISRHELRYGLDVALNTVESSAYKENIVTGERGFINTRYPDGGSSMNMAALYVTDAWELSDRLIVHVGARYSMVDLMAKIDSTNLAVDVVSDGDTTKSFFLNHTRIEQQNQALNGSLGLIFKPGAGWQINLLSSTGFRAPNVDDTGKLFDSGAVPGGAILLPNKDLRPEYVTGLDLGVAKSFAETWNISVTGYYNLIHDLITIDKAQLNAPNGLPYDDVLKQPYTNVNKDKAYTCGFNAQVAGRISKAFDISSSINYTYGRMRTDSTDQPLDHIPPLFGRSALNFQMKQFRAEFYALYSGWKRIEDYRLGAEDNEIYATPEGMPAWYTLNIRGQYQVQKNLQVQLALENILNQHYRVFASGTSGAGRNLSITLRLRV